MRTMLVGFITDGRHSGIDKYLLGFCAVAGEAGVKLDFLTQKADPELRERLAGYGFGLIEAPSLKRPLRQYNAFKRVLREGGYDAVYLNLSEAFNCTLLSAAKACGVTCRVAHSHSSGVDRSNPVSRFVRRFLHKLFRPRLSRLATERIACSSVAGEWMFSRPYRIIRNAVDGGRFAFDPAAREEMRRELDLSDRRALIHVGNCCYQKNQEFLLDVMRALLEKGEDAVLLLVGEGPSLPMLRARARSLGVADHVRFLGIRTDIPALLSAADVFVFPSRFEGFGIACAEAQFSGIPCVFSEAVPREVRVSEDVAFLKTDKPAVWADQILRDYGPRKPARLYSESRLYDAAENKKELLSIIRDEEERA